MCNGGVLLVAGASDVLAYLQELPDVGRTPIESKPARLAHIWTARAEDLSELDPIVFLLPIELPSVEERLEIRRCSVEGSPTGLLDLVAAGADDLRDADPLILLQGRLPAVLEEGPQVGIGPVQDAAGSVLQAATADACNLSDSELIVLQGRRSRHDLQEVLDVIVTASQSDFGVCLDPWAATLPQLQYPASIGGRNGT
ncbi:hypothetical protein PL81_19800 [Streptomyces sp. RSD-27]|nr:hypothetical protein PL81_19800 [Streptomyces sp. RSD-27]